MPFNTAYVDTNIGAVANAGCYVVGDKAFFNFACIFAANLGWDAQAQRATLQFNQTVSNTLNGTDTVASLQAKGIKVLLSVLNNNDQAGWSCFTDEQSAAYFVKQLADCVAAYGLDGIDIDDEYSNGTPNPTSLVMVSTMMRQSMPRTIISKALFRDIGNFQTNWQGSTLADNLDYGWEMSYWDPDGVGRLRPYLEAGMKPGQLGLGVSTDLNEPTQAATMAELVLANGYGGMMVYDVRTTAAPLCSAISQVFDSQPTTVIPNCLQSPQAPPAPSPAPDEAAEPEPAPVADLPRPGWLRRLLDRLFGH